MMAATIKSAMGAIPFLLCACAASLSHAADEFDPYGGFNGLSAEATGYFRLGTFGGRDFLITPYGHAFRAIGINHFHTMTRTDFARVVEELRSWGFNAGCYQGPRWMWQRVPYTKGINLVRVSQWKSGDQFGFADVFDPCFLDRLEKEVRSIVEPQRENRMLIGYFLTDIPLWERTRDGRGWISFYASLPADSAGGKVWSEWKTENPDTEESTFLAVIARQIYSKGTGLIRKYDSNHLVFSDRYHEVDIPDHVVKAVLPYVDAIAIQPTSREFNQAFFDTLHEKYGKPVYIADHVSSFATRVYPATMGQAAGE